jgi:hypothetical protein
MKGLRIINIVALIAMLIVNTLASVTSLIGGQQTAAVSDGLPTLFTPAGYVFSIWSLIYLGLIAFAVFQARNTADATAVRDKIGPWFAANALFNVIWLFLWGAERLWPSVIVMLGLLGTLIIIYQNLGIGRVLAGGADDTKLATWAVRVPFSIYTGWISVATIANLSAAFVSSGWQGGALGPRFWTVIVLLAGTALGLLATWLRRDVAYALVVIWAFIGIAVARPQETLVMWVAILGATVVAVGIVSKLTGWRPKPL